jgi:hypothetical protein
MIDAFFVISFTIRPTRKHTGNQNRKEAINGKKRIDLY